MRDSPCRDAEPHDWQPRYDVRTGRKTVQICTRCYNRETVHAEELRVPLEEGLTPAAVDQLRKCVVDALPALVSAVRRAVALDAAFHASRPG